MSVPGASTVDWTAISVQGHKGVYRVVLDEDQMAAVQKEAGCHDMSSARCRRAIVDLVLDGLGAHRRLPIVKHDDHIWFGRYGDGWTITFFSR